MVRRLFGHSWSVLALGAALVAGCQSGGPQFARPASPPVAKEGVPQLSKAQAADVQVALGHSLEKRNLPDEAAAAYREAIQRDPNRTDAVERLAVLCDMQGNFAESARLHRQALAAQPANADLHCNYGYSLYLQRNWPEAEAALRRAVALAPEHKRALNNLGLVLAHTGKEAEAVAAFRRAGCTEADAQNNLAFALALERRLPDARAHYEQAVAANPNSMAAREGLRQVLQLSGRDDASGDERGRAGGVVQVSGWETP
jgi:Tfp pilus assembly protein PilF